MDSSEIFEVNVEEIDTDCDDTSFEPSGLYLLARRLPLTFKMSMLYVYHVGNLA